MNLAIHLFSTHQIVAESWETVTSKAVEIPAFMGLTFHGGTLIIKKDKYKFSL